MTKLRRVCFGLLAAGAAGVGYSSCESRELDVGPPPPPAGIAEFERTAGWPAYARTIGGEPRLTPIDVLFMVDDSSAMRTFQLQIARAFDAFMTVMDGAFVGKADLHIGVVSADMGAGDGSITGCFDPAVPVPGRGAGGGPGGAGQPTGAMGSDHGSLQATPRGTCTATTLTGGDRFIAVSTDPVTGARVTNFTARSASDVFGCIAVMGEQGCGFEQPLSSVRHALDPALAPSQNAGFLRPDAFLAVILVTNEDDCSSPTNTLYDTIDNRTIDSPLGPLQNFRCNEFGHLCMFGGELRRPPRTASEPLEGCRSAEDGMLDRVSDFVGFLRGLKRDPAQVFVGAIAGPAAPYQVQTRAPSISDVAPWPEIAHSCTVAPGVYADPAVRINELATSLGARGAFETICAGDMVAPLQRIARAIVKPFSIPCVTPPAKSTDCEVVERWVDQDGVKHVASIPACEDNGHNYPCWTLSDHGACGSGTRFVSLSGARSPSPDAITAINCAPTVP